MHSYHSETKDEETSGSTTSGLTSAFIPCLRGDLMRVRQKTGCLVTKSVHRESEREEKVANFTYLCSVDFFFPVKLNSAKS